MKRLKKGIAVWIAVTAMVCVGTASHAMLSKSSVFDEAVLLSSVPSPESRVYGLISAGGGETVEMLSNSSTSLSARGAVDYVYDESIMQRLNLELSSTSDSEIKDYTFYSGMGETAAILNTTLASIYSRYLEKCLVPLKDPLWMIGIGSVEYNYTTNDRDVIFSFPVDVNAAAQNPNYLLEYDWREVQRIGGEAAPLRRDGSSIGIFQMIRSYGTTVEPVIPEDFGLIGSNGERRTDCWVTLGDGTSTGANIVWKPGVNGDRWSPSDAANIVCAVYNAALRDFVWPSELSEKYEKAVILMWAHNRGMRIIGNPEYISKSKSLAACSSEIRDFVRLVKPSRFIRSSDIMSKVRDISSRTTDGDIYPVMALMSYIITECRYSGEW